MTSANVELVRSIYGAWERGDFSSDEWAELDIEVVRPDGMALGNETGTADMAELWRDFLSTWEHLRVGAKEVRELDDERVLVLARFSGRAKTSGLEAESVWGQAASLFQLREGKVYRLVLYIDARRALADLGLGDTDEFAPPGRS
jgi:ketosteroid isomerase-like protein